MDVEERIVDQRRSVARSRERLETRSLERARSRFVLSALACKIQRTTRRHAARAQPMPSNTGEIVRGRNAMAAKIARTGLGHNLLRAAYFPGCIVLA